MMNTTGIVSLATAHVAQLAGFVLDQLEGHAGALIGDVGHGRRAGEAGAQRGAAIQYSSMPVFTTRLRPNSFSRLITGLPGFEATGGVSSKIQIMSLSLTHLVLHGLED